jgi:hypothetical protein
MIDFQMDCSLAVLNQIYSVLTRLTAREDFVNILMFKMIQICLLSCTVVCNNTCMYLVNSKERLCFACTSYLTARGATQSGYPVGSGGSFPGG